MEEGLLRTKDVVQVGIRGPLTEAHDLAFAEKAGFEIVMVDEVKRDLEAVRRKLASFVGRGPTYVSFDMDAIDPAYAPGTGTPVPGGLTSYEALSLLRALAGVSVVGLDVVEISPDHDATGNTSLLAATLLAQMLASLAQGRAKAGSRTPTIGRGSPHARTRTGSPEAQQPRDSAADGSLGAREQPQSQRAGCGSRGKPDP